MNRPPPPPVSARHGRTRPIVVDMSRLRLERVLRELKALQRLAEDFQTESVIARAIEGVVRLDRHLAKMALGVAR